MKTGGAPGPAEPGCGSAAPGRAGADRSGASPGVQPFAAPANPLSKAFAREERIASQAFAFLRNIAPRPQRREIRLRIVSDGLRHQLSPAGRIAGSAGMPRGKRPGEAFFVRSSIGVILSLVAADGPRPCRTGARDLSAVQAAPGFAGASFPAALGGVSFSGVFAVSAALAVSAAAALVVRSLKDMVSIL